MLQSFVDIFCDSSCDNNTLCYFFSWKFFSHVFERALNLRQSDKKILGHAAIFIMSCFETAYTTASAPIYSLKLGKKELLQAAGPKQSKEQQLSFLFNIAATIASAALHSDVSKQCKVFYTKNWFPKMHHKTTIQKFCNGSAIFQSKAIQNTIFHLLAT